MTDVGFAGDAGLSLVAQVGVIVGLSNLLRRFFRQIARHLIDEKLDFACNYHNPACFNVSKFIFL